MVRFWIHLEGKATWIADYWHRSYERKVRFWSEQVLQGMNAKYEVAT